MHLPLRAAVRPPHLISAAAAAASIGTSSSSSCNAPAAYATLRRATCISEARRGTGRPGLAAPRRAGRPPAPQAASQSRVQHALMHRPSNGRTNERCIQLALDNIDLSPAPPPPPPVAVAAAGGREVMLELRSAIIGYSSASQCVAYATPCTCHRAQ